MGDELDLVSKLTGKNLILAEQRLKSVCPDDGKYAGASVKLSEFLSAEAEWRTCALVQKVLLETRMEFGQAEQRHVSEVEAALQRISPLNMDLLERKLHHDQLAVIEEIGRFVSPETKALLHPGTTSYDILDTARSYLLKHAWTDMIPEIQGVINKLCDTAEENIDTVQVGRTHLQVTAPVLFGGVLAAYAARMAERVARADKAFGDLRGKISGIVGTGASIEMVVGEGRGLEFEARVLEKLNLKPDPTATQIVQKERLADCGHYLVTLMAVAADFANDMRLLYSSGIEEVTSLDAKARLAGSSADAGKNNPINYENVAGKYVVVESGMRVLYAMIPTDLQRDLRSSVQARYQPQMMMVEVFESFGRLSRELEQLFVNKAAMQRNLQRFRDSPTEALTSIARANAYVHPEYGVGHDAVKKFARESQSSGRKLMDVAFADGHFRSAFESWSDLQKCILQGEAERYLGFSRQRAVDNIAYARKG